MNLFTAETPLQVLEEMVAALMKSNDPWAQHWLILPGAGRPEWVQRQWARRAGIASRSQIVSLRSLLEQAASPGRDPFSMDRLVLTVAQVLPTYAGVTPLPNKVDDGALHASRLAWAQQLADAIDVGLLTREGALAWKESPLLEHLVQDEAVRGALSGHLGTVEPAQFKLAAQSWTDKWQNPSGVPHLWIQLDAGVPAVLLRCLVKLLALVPPDRVHLSLLCPTSPDASARGQVIQALGRRAGDLIDQTATLLGANPVTLRPSNQTPLANRLLAQLQAACHPGVQAVPLEGAPRSFSVHGCRSALRELEVCRDRIQQAMVANKDLNWDDFLVLLADPAAQFPLVPAAFHPLPVRGVGVGGSAVSPFASALERLLKALSGRLGLVDLQGLIEEPLIAQHFGLAEEAAQVVEWLQDANFRWGVDSKQRAEAQGTDDPRWSADFALRRLGLGAVIETVMRDALVDGTVPLERATGLSIPLLAGLARLAAALAEARDGWKIERTVADWRAWLTERCDAFIARGDDAANQQRTKFLNLLLPSLATAAPADLLLRNDAFRRLVSAQLATLTATRVAPGGGITVADLRQHAGTPARVVLIAGLGAETFPRRDEWPAWHPLAQRREIGDPSKRDDDRHALLLALLAASERLVLTYQDGSDEDTKERPPSTPLADLLGIVDAVALPAAGVLASKLVTYHHGLNGFSPATFAAGTDADTWSFGEGDHAGAVLLADRHNAPYAGLWVEALPEADSAQPLSFDNLKALFVEPCGIFLTRLGLRLPEESGELSQADVLNVNGLDSWGLADRMLQTMLAGDDVDALKRRATAAGDLPRGRYGETVWNELLDEIPASVDENLRPLNETLQLQVAGRTLDVTLPSGWYRAPDGTIHFRSASKPSTKYQLAVKLGLLCLARGGKADRVFVRFRTQSSSTEVVAPSADRLDPLLTDVVHLYALAQRLPLPFWPDSYDAMKQAETAALALEAGRSKWSDGGGFVGAPPPASSQRATRICYRGLEDPFGPAQTVETDVLPHPGTPLAWRIFAFVLAFEQAFQRAEP